MSARDLRPFGAPAGPGALAGRAAAAQPVVRGAGPLQPLLDEPGVTDVLVNGAGSVWVDRGAGLERRTVDLGPVAQIRALAVRLAASGGQRLDDAAPVVDARLPDGTRLHAVLPPVAPEGPLISLRAVRPVAIPLGDLVASGSVAPPVGRVLDALVRRRATVLVSGATGSGKTTLLASLLSLVPHDERVVVVEEAGELAPDHPHVARLTTRRANVEGAGAVDLAELVRHALRMRPDRLVLGEARGAEVREVLTAFTTGHPGFATLHATDAHEVPARVEALAALAGMGRAAVAAQAGGAIDAVVHVRRVGALRHVAEVGAVVRSPDGAAWAVEPVLRADAGGAVVAAPGWPAAALRWGVPG